MKTEPYGNAQLGPPAADHEIRFTTADRQAAHAKLVDVFVEHDLRFTDERPMRCRLEMTRSKAFVMSRLQFGIDIAFDASPMRTAYQINIPLRGVCDLVQGGTRRTVAAGHEGVVMGPDRPLSFHWDERSVQYAMKFPRGALEAHAARLTGLDRLDRIDFDMAFPLDTPAGRSLLSTAHFMFREFAQSGELYTAPLVCAQMESAFMTHLLCVLPSQITPLLNRTAGRTGRSRISDVVAYIEQHPEARLEIADLAELANMGPRALQLGFRDVVGTTPTAYVRGVRLDRAHQDLLSGMSVTEAATRWGFCHLSHFGQHYRKRFGVTPSETARRS